MRNRVNPFGRIIETKARGTWMGNRGRIHDEKKQITGFYKLKAWIVCRLEFGERKRSLMSPTGYTELFFLDEATAFAAGHRPCFECRREDSNRFKRIWLLANPEYGLGPDAPVEAIDRVLHKERLDADGEKQTYRELLKNLPDGTMICIGKSAYLIAEGRPFQWTPYGYDQTETLAGDIVEVLTPRSIVNMFRAGYKPQMDLKK